MAEDLLDRRSRAVANIISAFPSSRHTLVLGLSSSLTAGAVYSYIVSNYHYFTPALGIVAGLVGGLGIAAREILSERKKLDDVPVEDLMVYILFGIVSLILGYIFVYYLVKLPGPHGAFFLPSEQGEIYDFFKAAMGPYDVIGAVLGSICSSAIPILLKEKIENLLGKSRFSQ